MSKAYYSNIAKMCNVWRAPSKAAAIYKSWASLFGVARAKKVAGRLPPRPLVGRFGAVHKTCQFFIGATMHETAAVYNEVFKKPKVPGATDGITIDPDGEDWETQMGRWERDAVAAANSIDHWVYMASYHLAGAPLMHLLHWFEKKGSNIKSDRDKLFSHDHVSTIQELLYFKASEIMGELN
eukprot:7120353-Pyramimonas_sp.AAC.1